MAEARTINIPGNGNATQQYELAPGLLQYVQAVYVEVDNSAGAAARPVLTLSEQSGVVIAKKRQGEAIPAAGSGSATWALRLDDNEGDIRYDRVNSGDWLDIHTTGNLSPDGGGIDLVADNAGIHLTATDPTVGEVIADTAFFHILANGGNVRIDNADLVQSVSNDVSLQANASVDIEAGSPGITLTSTKLGFFGAAAAAQPAHPVTLGDVIAALQTLGLVA